MKKNNVFLIIGLIFLAGCSESVLDFRNAEISNNKIFELGANQPFTGKVTNFPYFKLPAGEVSKSLNIYSTVTGDKSLFSALQISGLQTFLNDGQGESLVLCDVKVREGVLNGKAKCHLNRLNLEIVSLEYKNNTLDGDILINSVREDKTTVKAITVPVTNGVFNGEMKVWNKNSGKVVYIAPFQSGKLNGQVKINSANGELIWTETYQDGKLVEKVSYDPNNGNKIGVMNYDNDGLANGINVIYLMFDEKSKELLDYPKIIDISEYKDSKRHGKVIQINPQTGETLSELTYKDDLPFNGLNYTFSNSNYDLSSPVKYIDGKTEQQIQDEKMFEEQRKEEEQREKEYQERIEKCVKETRESYNAASEENMDWTETDIYNNCRMNTER